MNKTPKFEAPTWSKIYRMLLRQAKCIRKSNFKPDLIVGLSRGGWLPARILSDLLENPKLASIKIESYVGIEYRGKSVLTQELAGSVLAGKSVLLVDEVADTGESLKLAKSYISREGALETRVATLYVKPKSAFKPDYCEEITDCWIVFPWEIKETIRRIWEANQNDDAQQKEQLSRLRSAGVPKRLISQFTKEICEA